MKSLKRCLLISTILIGVATMALGWSCSPAGYSGAIERLAIGSTHKEADTLIYVADEGFFAKSGLSATIKDYGGFSAANVL